MAPHQRRLFRLGMGDAGPEYKKTALFPNILHARNPTKVHQTRAFARRFGLLDKQIRSPRDNATLSGFFLQQAERLLYGARSEIFLCHGLPLE